MIKRMWSRRMWGVIRRNANITKITASIPTWGLQHLQYCLQYAPKLFGSDNSLKHCVNRKRIPIYIKIKSIRKKTIMYLKIYIYTGQFEVANYLKLKFAFANCKFLYYNLCTIISIFYFSFFKTVHTLSGVWSSVY